MSVHWNEWKRVAKKVADTFKTNSLPWKVARDAYLLLCEEELRSDVLFLAAFGTDLFMPCLHWLQGKDEYSQLYGHCARSMPEFYYHLHSSLTSIGNGGWKQRDSFKACVNQLSDEEVDSERKEKKFSIFFETFTNNATKHFNAWVSTQNITCAIGGEPPLASAFAKWILDDTLPNENLEFTSTTHNNFTFHTRDYLLFIAKHNTRTDITGMKWVHCVALEEMANGLSLWDDTTSVAIALFCRFVKSQVLAFMSSTHWIEFLIKETSLAATTGRDEGMGSAIVMIRSVLNPDVLSNPKAYVKAKTQSVHHGELHETRRLWRKD